MSGQDFWRSSSLSCALPMSMRRISENVLWLRLVASIRVAVGGSDWNICFRKLVFRRRD